MSKNPIINALAAEAYIIGIVLFMHYVLGSLKDTEETIVIPMAMLSLFVLSASLMGYFFVVEPVKLYLDGAKEEAVKLFLRTVGVFAVITTSVFVALFVTTLR